MSSPSPSSSESAVCDSIFSTSDVESGYSSSSEVDESPVQFGFTKPHLRFLNQQLAKMEPQDVLRWCMISLPNLYQTTAFGLTGLVILDMISKLSEESPGLIFLDTLHHFPETLALVERVREQYPRTSLRIYKPEHAETVENFNAMHGEELWSRNEEKYDWVAKVEPAERAYRELQVSAVLTGRRRSQGGKRGDLNIIEVSDSGLIKINPLASWDFERVRKYIDDNNVPYNELLDRGYKSVGDWHSTQPVKEGEDERAGRWKGQQKSECGIHNKRSRYAQFLMEMELKRQREEQEAGVGENAPDTAAQPETQDNSNACETIHVDAAPLSDLAAPAEKQESQDRPDLAEISTDMATEMDAGKDIKANSTHARVDSATAVEMPSLEAGMDTLSVSSGLLPLALL